MENHFRPILKLGPALTSVARESSIELARFPTLRASYKSQRAPRILRPIPLLSSSIQRHTFPTFLLMRTPPTTTNAGGVCVVGLGTLWGGAGCCARACGVEGRTSSIVSVLAAGSGDAHSGRVSIIPNWTSSLANRPVAAIACGPAEPMRSTNCSSSCTVCYGI